MPRSISLFTAVFCGGGHSSLPQIKALHALQYRVKWKWVRATTCAQQSPKIFRGGSELVALGRFPREEQPSHLLRFGRVAGVVKQIHVGYDFSDLPSSQSRRMILADSWETAAEFIERGANAAGPTHPLTKRDGRSARLQNQESGEDRGTCRQSRKSTHSEI